MLSSKRLQSLMRQIDYLKFNLIQCINLQNGITQRRVEIGHEESVIIAKYNFDRRKTNWDAFASAFFYNS